MLRIMHDMDKEIAREYIRESTLEAASNDAWKVIADQLGNHITYAKALAVLDKMREVLERQEVGL